MTRFRVMTTTREPGWVAMICPRSVVLFERLLIVSTIPGVIAILLYNDKRFALAIFLTLTGVFWFFITRRASNIARWLLVIALGMGLIKMPGVLAQSLQLGFTPVLLHLAVTALRIAAAALLFRKDAAEWFRNKGKVVDYADVFS